MLYDSGVVFQVSGTRTWAKGTSGSPCVNVRISADQEAIKHAVRSAAGSWI